MAEFVQLENITKVYKMGEVEIRAFGKREIRDCFKG